MRESGADEQQVSGCMGVFLCTVCLTVCVWGGSLWAQIYTTMSVIIYIYVYKYKNVFSIYGVLCINTHI